MQCQTAPRTPTQGALAHCDRRRHLKNALRADDTQADEGQGLESDRRKRVLGEGSGTGNGGEGQAGRLFWKLRSVLLHFPKEAQRELSMCIAFIFPATTINIMGVITVLK